MVCSMKIAVVHSLIILRRLLTVALLAFFILSPMRGQGLREIPAAVRSAQASGNRDNTRLHITRSVVHQKAEEGGTTIVAVRPDSVLYRHIVRRHTWLEGLGCPISQAEADTLPLYFKLSIKSEAGHWQHVEAMQGNAPTTNHHINSYLLDTSHDYGREVDARWIRRLRSVCQWYFFSDPSGKQVFEERAYDAEGNMMYAFTPVPLAEDIVVGSYTDALGMPAEIVEDTTLYYGTVVRIKYTPEGYDHTIRYMDGAGYVRPNVDCIYEKRMEYDPASPGRLTTITNGNPVGFRMEDRYGVCITRYTYNDVGDIIATDYADRDGQPIKHQP